MPLPSKNKIRLLVIFYKSTLTLSIGLSGLLAALNVFNLVAMLFAFGVCFLSGGTVVTLLYKEMTRKHEYYFYYNKGISKPMLFTTCIIGNLLIGITLISIAHYA